VEAVIYTNSAAGEGSDVLLAIENLTGSPLADKLTVSLEANRMKGLGGADELRGRNSKDWLSGGWEPTGTSGRVATTPWAQETA